jgi:hypothetical protein
MSVESYAHKAAKDLMASWFREIAAEAGHDNYAYFLGVYWRVNRPGPNWGVWTEYPVMRDERGLSFVWDECGWGSPCVSEKISDFRPPTFRELKKQGEIPGAILDVAIQHKGGIPYAIEICHKHPVSDEKLEFLHEQNLGRLLEIPAKWVLGQVRRPKSCPDSFWRLGEPVEASGTVVR